jgi:hypothetical protein
MMVRTFITGMFEMLRRLQWNFCKSLSLLSLLHGIQGTLMNIQIGWKPNILAIWINTESTEKYLCRMLLTMKSGKKIKIIRPENFDAPSQMALESCLPIMAAIQCPNTIATLDADVFWPNTKRAHITKCFLDKWAFLIFSLCLKFLEFSGMSSYSTKE